MKSQNMWKFLWLLVVITLCRGDLHRRLLDRSGEQVGPGPGGVIPPPEEGEDGEDGDGTDAFRRLLYARIGDAHIVRRMQGGVEIGPGLPPPPPEEGEGEGEDGDGDGTDVFRRLQHAGIGDAPIPKPKPEPLKFVRRMQGGVEIGPGPPPPPPEDGEGEDGDGDGTDAFRRLADEGGEGSDDPKRGVEIGPGPAVPPPEGDALRRRRLAGEEGEEYKVPPKEARNPPRPHANANVMFDAVIAPEIVTSKRMKSRHIPPSPLM